MDGNVEEDGTETINVVRLMAREPRPDLAVCHFIFYKTIKNQCGPVGNFPLY